MIAAGEEFRWGAARGQMLHVACNGSSPEPEITQWSRYQEDIFEWFVNGQGSAIIEAVAGSGKTTLLREAARRKTDVEIKYLVFNNRNAREAQEKMPAHVDTSTFHSAGWQPLSARLGHRNIDGRKTYKIVRDMTKRGFLQIEEEAAWSHDIERLVDLAKSMGVGVLVPDEVATWLELIDHHGIEFDRPDLENGWDDADKVVDRMVDEQPKLARRVVEIARAVLKEGNADLSTVDFSDMIYQTVRLGLALPRFDIVMVDEAQDTNPTRRALLRMLLKAGGRLVAVGDRRQALYGFTGADADAMDLIANDFNCREFPLSVNYRCSRAVIREARPHCPQLEAWDGAPEGSVEAVEFIKLSEFRQSDAILCRLNAPLITLAYRFVGAGVPCTVMGRDIGAGLVSLVKRLQGKGKNKDAMTIDEIMARAEHYRIREVGKALVQGREDKAQSVTDKVQSLLAAIDGLGEDERTITGLVARIEHLFSDPKQGEQPDKLTLATCHKAKGLEWSRVWVLDPQLMPSKWARKGWQVVQERNVMYVAYTRAQMDLRFVHSSAIAA